MIDEFVAERRVRWKQLEELLKQARGRKGERLSATELEELGRGYRRVASDLAIARRDFPRDRVTRYLEQLAGRAHPVVYRREAARWAQVRTFFTSGFPRAFRGAWPYTTAAFVLFALPFLAAYVAVQVDPLLGRIMPLPPSFVDGIEHGRSWLEIQGDERGLAASMIMTNNIQISFLAVAGGILVGLGTAYVLFYNGLVLGAVASMASVYGLSGQLADFVAAHSGIELSVVFVAGGCGLRLGHAILAPGLLSRGAALSRAARAAIQLVFGCVPLLMVAGTLEGFVSPSSLPTAAKLAIGGTATVLLYAYLLLADRGYENRMARVGKDSQD